jgi:general secretion pathway protein G
LAIKNFQKDTSRFPTKAEGLDALIQNPGNLKGWNGPYFKKSIPLDPWGRAYIYKFPGFYGIFDLYSCDPDGVSGTSDDVYLQ